MDGLELWVGPECTVNRVGDTFRDQLRETGHHDRPEDLDLFAALGATRIRYPILWERVSPDQPDRFDWTWTDARLHRLRQLNMRPIAGLVHHGSGPAYTNLLDEGFAPGLAAFARAAAERYPWIEAWTPVNEPVTTARFSALYGLWYPHAQDERSFWLALLNQIDGVRLAMAEIRQVIPGAKLIQTDDLGRTYATAPVRDQAAFDNQRRWMGWDLLCGQVMPGHPFWNRLCAFGFERRLLDIARAPCPPDVIGVNHYLTSDRFLDHRVQRYPQHLTGGNENRAFVDTEAVRVLSPPPPGFRGALLEAWNRFRLPMAITEAHNGCTREEQMRWTTDAWCSALDLRAQGIDVRAVTSWSLLGGVGWNTLLTQQGCYEPGAFDISSGTPQPTAMAALLQTLSHGGEQPGLCDAAGWWRRPIRLQYQPTPRPAPMSHYNSATASGLRGRALLLVTSDPAIAGKIAAACAHRNLALRIEPDLSTTRVEPADFWAILLFDPSPLDRRQASDSTLTWMQAHAADDPNALLDRLIDDAMRMAVAPPCQ